MKNDKDKKKKLIFTPKPAVPQTKKHGLGRGLGALIKPSAPTEPIRSAVAAATENPVSESARDGTSVVQAQIVDIQRCPWQPRHVFNDEGLQDLTESIRTHGIISPLLCRRIANGKFELIAGERRLRAATAAELKTVPVVLLEAEDQKAAEIAIIENIQRQDLNAIEEAEGYKTLAQAFGLTQQEVAERVGKSRTGITNAVRLLDLPDEVKQFVADGRLSVGHAKILLGLESIGDQTALACRCVTESLTVRALEKIVQKRTEPKPEPEVGAVPDMPESHLRDLSDRLHRFFGTSVRLSPSVLHANGRRSKGCLEVDFYDNTDLDRILEVLGITLND